jgi:DNA-binding transcriptional ArsR family regulator
VERHVGASAQLVQYHVKKLEEEGLVEAHEQGGYTRYYPTAPGRHKRRVPKEDLPVVGLLREEVPLHIVLVLLDEGPRTHGELVERLGVAKSTASYHLAKLAEAGIVGRVAGSARIGVVAPAHVRRLLKAYAPTPDLLDAFADLWEDLYGSSR